MSHVDDYNNGKIDAAELNRRVTADINNAAKRGIVKYIAIIICAILVGWFAANHIMESVRVTDGCIRKYPVSDTMSSKELDSLRYLQKACEKGLD